MFTKKTTEYRDLIVSFKRAFATEDGKKVLYELMNRFHVLNPHDGNSFKEGQRSVVLYIMGSCNVGLKQLDEMLKQGEIE